MNNIKKQLKTVAEAIEVIKELQTICKDQKEKIKSLENLIEKLKYSYKKKQTRFYTRLRKKSF